MRINYSKKFQKAFLRLDKVRREKVLQAIQIFQLDPFHKTLRNHVLKGHLSGKRAISVAFDVRIIFEEHGDYTLVLMLDVGTHNQVYGR